MLRKKLNEGRFPWIAPTLVITLVAWTGCRVRSTSVFLFMPSGAAWRGLATAWEDPGAYSLSLRFFQQER